MKIGRYKVTFKPLTYLIAVSTVVGLVGGPVILYVTISRASSLPSYGYLKPNQWKFEARGTAVAEATFGQKTASGDNTTNGQKVFLGDIQKGVSVHISSTGKTPDCVYLRNGMNMAMVQGNKDLDLSFEAAAPVPRPVVVAIRDNSTSLWHEKFDVQPVSHEFHTTIPIESLRKAKSGNLIIAVHLGFKDGDVWLRNFSLR